LSAADVLAGVRVSSDAGEVGRARGIDVEGRLVVARDDGTVARWSAGEVHLV
jgi:biotin-(acetyl-CoA carboxylase) ligase